MKIGLNESMVLQQMHYWININKQANRNLVDGHYWTYNTYEGWHEQFPFWSIRTLKTIMTSLESKGLVVSANHNKLKIDRTKWYRIDYTKLDSLVSSPIVQDLHDGSADVAPPLPETNDLKTKKDKMVVDDHHNASDKSDGRRVFEPIGHVFSNEDEDIKRILSYYYEIYRKRMKKMHPKLKISQLDSVYQNLSDAINRYSIDVNTMKQLIDEWFRDTAVKTDYNINHFSQDGILRVRLYHIGSGYLD